jgi:putative oxidoreductase
MVTSAISPVSSYRLKVFGLVLRIVFALIFIGAGAAKLFGLPTLVQEFDIVGLGQWFRYFTGVVEITGAVLLLLPRTTFYGAGLLATVSIGAGVAQLMVLHGDVIHAVVMALILLAIAWTERRSFTELFAR